MSNPGIAERFVEVKAALVERDYRQSTSLEQHPVRLCRLTLSAESPLDQAVLSALEAAGERLLSDAGSVAVFLAHITDATLITNSDFRAIDASIRDGVVHWNEYEWASHLPSLNEVSKARAEGLYPAQYVDLVVFPIVDDGWGEAGQAGLPEVGLWLAEHGVGVATWFGEALRDNVVGLAAGYLAARGERAHRMRRAVVMWRETGTDRPQILRVIVDRRSSWDVDRLGRIMRLDRKEARQLLRSLGYGKSGDGLYRRKRGRKARARRAAWLRDEIDV